MKTKEIVLSGIGYNVCYMDGQFLFEASRPVHTCHTRFAFERPNDINETPGTWQFVDIDASSGRIPASHLVRAIQWLEDNAGKSFEPFRIPAALK